MKYLKTLESLKLIKDWGLELSKEKFDKYSKEFDLIMETFLEYAHMGYNISFTTAYGAEVNMTYDDYNLKNEKYEEFIHGLPAHGLFFDSNIIMPYDYNNLLNIMDDIQACIGRLGDSGWEITEFNIRVHPINKFGNPRIIISHSFIKNK